MDGPPINVFIDANLIIRLGRPPGGPIFERLVDLVHAEFIKIVTTDLTKHEVAKKHVENDYNVIKEMGRPHFRNLVSELFGVELPRVGKLEIRDTLSKNLEPKIEKMFSSVKAKVLSIDKIKPSSVFSYYKDGTGFFSEGGKKDQFPDAFVFECLKRVASEDSPLLIISDDGDFEGPVDAIHHISILKSIPDLFKQLGLEVEAPKIGEFLQDNQDRIAKIAEAELSNYGLEAIDVEGAYIEQEGIINFELSDTTAFGQVGDEGSILVVGTTSIEVSVSFTHPDWDSATYDSEDKVLIPRHDVMGGTTVELEADFSMTILLDDDGNPVEVDEFRFRNDDFVWIVLHSMEY